MILVGASLTICTSFERTPGAGGGEATGLGACAGGGGGGGVGAVLDISVPEVQEVV